ncbi:hypothetical protein TWF481_000805 [Arthrobotrys musiformis]|uniref:Uncharacterized protein n=1 Tax=Arthrobotrys musiformis TaxID=47236 RepID=A0AAV9WNV3_9PEZI
MKFTTPVLLSMVSMAIRVSADTEEATPTGTYDAEVTDASCPAKFDVNCPYYCNSRGQGSFCSPNFITGPGTPGCYVCPGIPSECPATPSEDCAYICTGSDDINLGPGAPNVFCAPSNASLGPLGGSTTKAISCVPCEDDTPVISTPSDPATTTAPSVPTDDGETTTSPPSDDTTATPSDDTTTAPPSDDTTTAAPPAETTLATYTQPSSNVTTDTPELPPSNATITAPPPEYTGAASKSSIGGAAILGLAAMVLFSF